MNIRKGLVVPEIVRLQGYPVLSVQVVGSDEGASRLLLCEATAMTVRECFKLLGVWALDRLGSPRRRVLQ